MRVSSLMALIVALFMLAAPARLSAQDSTGYSAPISDPKVFAEILSGMVVYEKDCSFDIDRSEFTRKYDRFIEYVLGNGVEYYYSNRDRIKAHMLSGNQVTEDECIALMFYAAVIDNMFEQPFCDPSAPDARDQH